MNTNIQIEIIDVSFRLLKFQEYFKKYIGHGKPMKEVEILKEALLKLMDNKY